MCSNRTVIDLYATSSHRGSQAHAVHHGSRLPGQIPDDGLSRPQPPKPRWQMSESRVTWCSARNGSGLPGPCPLHARSGSTPEVLTVTHGRDSNIVKLHKRCSAVLYPEPSKLGVCVIPLFRSWLRETS
jgi:hypothetical protein